MAPARILVVEDENPAGQDLQDRLRRLGFRVKAYSESEWGLSLEDALRRHAMEAKLAESQEWFFTTLRSLGEAVVASDEEGRITFLNPGAEALTGWRQAEACGRPLTEVLRLEPPGGGKESPGEAPAVSTASDVLEAEAVSRNGERTPVEAKSALIRDAAGKTLGQIRILRDVTDRKRTEAGFRRSERRFRDLVDASRDIIFTLSADGRITSLNPAFEKATGRAVRDWLFRPFAELLHPADAAAAMDAFQSILRGEWLPPMEMRILTAAGGEIAVECASTPVGKDDPTGGIWGIARDITSRRNLEQRVLQSQKMEAVGRMAGTIAHDFNNLLTTINGHADIMNQSLESHSPLLINVKGILAAVDRAANLTRELLALGRQQPLSPRNMDLNAAIDRFIPTLRGLSDDDIEIRFEPAPSLPALFADPGQIERVLAILASNSRDAMPKGGRLTLATALESRPGGGERILLKVADTGAGMGDEVKARLFEPFFTTKPVGKGSGLGLSAVYGIVKAAGGEIQVQSAPGQGTAFILSFPASAEAEVLETTAPAMPAESHTGAETILLVEDDDDVRFLLHSILKTQGYTVIEAKDGEQALATASGYGAPIHLVLTDLQMPKLGGRKLVEKLLSGNPGMKALFMSGFGREDFPDARDTLLPVTFLEKPFMPKSLVRQIRKVLDG